MSAVTTVDTGPRQVSRRVEVDAPASAIFDLLADPHRLAETAAGRTTVTETFDYSSAPLGKMFELSGRTATNARGITATLEQLRDRFA